MKCPIDEAELAMTERNGIEIDYCPKCREVWLDRGELDKIIERSGAEEASPRREEPRYADDDRRRDDGMNAATMGRAGRVARRSRCSATSSISRRHRCCLT